MLRDRWHPRAVLDDQEVVARRCYTAIGRCGHRERAAAGREGQRHIALVLVEGVGRRSVADQGDRADRGGIHRADAEARAKADRGRRGGDRRPGALEQVGRRVDLRTKTPGGLTARHEHAAVVEEHRRGVVHPGFGHGCDGRPGLGGRVPDLGVEHGLGLVIARAGPAQGDGRPVGEDREVHPAPREVERRNRPPRRRGSIHVDEGDMGQGRVAAAGSEHHAGLEHDGRLGVSARGIAVGRSRRPAAGAARRQGRRPRARARLEDLAVRKHEHQRIQALRPGRAGENGPRVADRVVDLGVRRASPVGSVTGGGQDLAVGQGRAGRVPAQVLHRGALRPGLAPGVEQGRHTRAVVGRAVLATDHDDPTVGEGGLAGAVEVAERRGHGREPAGCGVPHPGVVAGRPDQHLARRQGHHVLALEAPVEDATPLPDVRRSGGHGLGLRGQVDRARQARLGRNRDARSSRVRRRGSDGGHGRGHRRRGHQACGKQRRQAHRSYGRAHPPPPTAGTAA